MNDSIENSIDKGRGLFSAEFFREFNRLIDAYSRWYVGTPENLENCHPENASVDAGNSFQRPVLRSFSYELIDFETMCVNPFNKMFREIVEIPLSMEFMHKQRKDFG